jgi:hypothetical protein
MCFFCCPNKGIIYILLIDVHVWLMPFLLLMQACNDGGHPIEFEAWLVKNFVYH